MNTTREEQLAILKQATFSHLDDKRYLFHSRIPEKFRGKIVKDKAGQTVYTDRFHPPTPSKTVFLSIAFNMALATYERVRGKNAVKKIENLSKISEMMLRYFNNKYIDQLEDRIIHKKEDSKKEDTKKEDNKKNAPNGLLIDDTQNHQYAAIERFRNIEYKLYGVIKRLRNYHSHYIHEPGVLSFKNLLLEGEDSPLNQEEFDDAKVWFQKRFDDAKRHLNQSLDNRLISIAECIKKSADDRENNLLKKKKRQIIGVLKRFKYIKLLEQGQLTQEGQLFIACIFLTHRQAKIVLDRWRGLKDVEGYRNTLHTFFTYYSVKETYSINNYADDLLKFRNICSRLSTVPYIENDCLSFIYEKIKDLNELNYQKLNKIPVGGRDPETRAANNNKRKKIQKNIIPVRKKKILTQVLLQYLLDDGAFDKSNFRIAITKNQSDRMAYYEKHPEIDKEKSLTYLKNLIKTETEPSTHKKLLGHLKELKRNFIFCTPEELFYMGRSPIELKNSIISEKDDLNKTRLLNLFKKLSHNKKDTPEQLLSKLIKDENNMPNEPLGYRFSIKKNNALLQFVINPKDPKKAKNKEEGQKTEKKEKVTEKVNVSLSPDFLLKWVFLRLEGEDADGIVLKQLVSYVNMQIGLRKSGKPKNLITSLKNIPEYKDVNIKRMIPRCIVDVYKVRKGKTIKEKAKIKLKTQLKSLKSFKYRNEQQAKPWQYASKKKIDIILHYLQAKLLEDVYIAKIDRGSEDVTTYIRHAALNMDTYNYAREYFRYFGRYEHGTIAEIKDHVAYPVIQEMKEQHAILFGYIKDEIELSQSLEQLYEKVIEKQREYYEYHLDMIDNYDDDILRAMFKITASANADNVQQRMKDMYSKSIDVSADILSIKSISPCKWEAFINDKKAKWEQKNPNYTLADCADGSNMHNKKPFFNYSEYSYIREVMSEKGSHPKTNMDFIMERILKEEVGKKKDRKMGKVFKLLLKQKTQELVLWNVALAYWKKANNREAEYTIAEKPRVLKGDKERKHMTEAKVGFQDYCTFNKAYHNDIVYDIDIDAEFWKANNKKYNRIYKELSHDDQTINLSIRIPARRYDNKFLLHETGLIQQYLLGYHFDTAKKIIILKSDYEYPGFDYHWKVRFDLNTYDDVIKLVYKELRSSYRDIAELLGAEKKIILSDTDSFERHMDAKYKSAVLKDYYLSLSDKIGPSGEKVLYEEFLKIVALNTTEEKEIAIFKDKLITFRNAALHYQLHDKIDRITMYDLLKSINVDLGDQYYVTYE